MIGRHTPQGFSGAFKTTILTLIGMTAVWSKSVYSSMLHWARMKKDFQAWHGKKERVDGKFYLPVTLQDGLPRKAILSQLRLFDAKRLYQKLATVDEATHKKLEAAIIKLAQGK